MITRESYAVASIQDVTLGVQADQPGAQRLTSEDVWRGVAVLYAHARTPAAIDPDYVERFVRSMWPGRAFWFEVGDGERWVQVVEYGAFAAKPHKTTLDRGDLGGAAIRAANGDARLTALLMLARRVALESEHEDAPCLKCEAQRALGEVPVP